MMPVALPRRGRPRSIRSARLIPAPPDDAFAFLRELDNHWQLTAPAIVPVGADEGGAQLRLRGPLGLRRRARARVLEAAPPGRLVARAEVGRRTRGTVRWAIQGMDGGSWIDVAAVVDAAGALDRALLGLYGRRWLERRLEDALARLAERLGEVS